MTRLFPVRNMFRNLVALINVLLDFDSAATVNLRPAGNASHFENKTPVRTSVTIIANYP